MASRPDTYPYWATNDQVNPVSLQNNVLVPPPEKQQYGWEPLEFPPRNWLNWLGRTTNLWIEYLDGIANQSQVTTLNDGTPILFDIVNGGMAIVAIIDTTTPANYFLGITYIPPAYSSGTLNFTTIASSTLTLSAISVTGGITVAAGSGNYLIYGQMKN